METINGTILSLVVALVLITVIDVLLTPVIYKKKYNPLFLLLSPIIILTATAYSFYKTTESLMLTLATSNLLGFYYLSCATLVMHRFNKRTTNQKEPIIVGPVWLRVAGIVVMSSNAGYVGYLLSGSNFSILILLSVFFVSFLVMVFWGTAD